MPLNFSALALLSLQFLLPWLVSCSEQHTANVDHKHFQLTRESLNDFTLHLTGGSTDPHSVRPPADLVAEKSNWKLWTRYIIGSAVVLGSVDRCALSVIHRLWSENEGYLMNLLKELAKKNDLGIVVRFIAENTGEYFWYTSFGNCIIELVKDNWGTMRPLFERVFAILKENEDKGKEYGAMMRCMPVELQYEMINLGKISLDEIDKVYLFDKPPHSLLRRIFFQARCSPTPSPAIREYIAERVPWLKQFLSDAPNEFKDTVVTSIVEPGHDVWVRIRSFMDVETLILVWPSVCRTWDKSYSKMLAEDTRIHEWLLQDLSYVRWNKIHTIAPWRYFLNGNNSGLYLGRCILDGALGRAELDDGSNWEIRDYLCDAMNDMAPIPNAGKEMTRCESFAKLLEEGYKAYTYKMPTFCKPPFLTAEEHEKVIHHLVCESKLVVRLSCQWMIDNASRIYMILGDNQALIKEVIELSAYDFREALPIWIMIGQACGMTDDTAKLVFDKPGIYTEKFIRPVVVKPSEYYDHIAESGMLFEMLKDYYKHGWNTRVTCQISLLMISLFLSFKYKPDKIDKIVASMASQLPTLREGMLKWMKNLLGMGTMDILKTCGKYPPEDVAFVKWVLKRCGLLYESGI